MLENIKTKIPDNVLVGRVLHGEISAFELLMRRSNPALYKLGRAYGFGHHEVEDLMQETHIRAYRHLATFENRATYTTWALKILLRLCYQRRQRPALQNEVTTSTPVDENAVPMFHSSTAGDADRQVLSRELGALIEQAMLRLPIDYRVVFTLRELNGLSGAEAAAALDISEANVKMRLSRAKAMLREQLEKLYTPEEVFEFNLVYCDRIVERVLRVVDPPGNSVDK
jgi:RNA polymerase sigma factor (sigma-70 family)